MMNVRPPAASPPHVTALRRHFADLRDGTHGDHSTRREKEELFARAVDLLSPFATQVLQEINHHLLCGQGDVVASGLVTEAHRGQSATWHLTWSRLRDAGLRPVTLQAFYGWSFHHPHLRGATLGEWPLNVFTPRDAEAEVSTMRAIAAGDLHNLVFQADYRIVPALDPET